MNLNEIIEEVEGESPMTYTPYQGQALIEQHNNESTLVMLIQQLDVDSKPQEL